MNPKAPPPPREKPIKRRVRSLLDKHFKADSDLNAFLLDYFEIEYGLMNGRMDRNDKLEALFVRRTAIEVLEQLSIDKPHDVEIAALLSQVPADVPAEAAASSPMAQDDVRQKPVEPRQPLQSELSQILPGSWSIDYDRSTEFVLDIDERGGFRASVRSGGAVRTITGTWQVHERKRLLLRGEETLGLRVSPFATSLEFDVIAPQQLRATSNHQPVVWKRRA